MIEFFVHAGMEKTGTTSIQEILYNYKHHLKDKYRILYPNTFLLGKTHYLFSYSFINKFKTKLKFNVNNYSTLIYNFINELKSESNIEKVLISNEYLFKNLHTDLEVFLKEFSEIANFENFINIIVFLRRQDQWIESMIKQGIKDPLVRAFNIVSFKTHLIKTSLFLDYYNKLKELEQFGQIKTIFIKIYKSQNVISDFFGIFNINENFDYIQLNLSPSTISSMVLAKINQYFQLPLELHNKVVQFLIDLDKKHSYPLKVFLTLEERMNLLAQYKESNDKLFKEFLKSENQFILSEEEIEFYREQDEILRDKERLERDIRERYEIVMEYLRGIEPDFEKFRKERVTRSVISVSKGTDVYGLVEEFNRWRIRGWVVDLEGKETSRVVLRINGIEVLEKEVGIERGDLAKEFGLEDSKAGFEILWREVVFPEELRDWGNDKVGRIEVIHKRSGKLLQGGYWEMSVRELREITRSSGEIPYVVYTDEGKELIEFVNVDQLLIDALRGGRLIIGGLVVLRKEIKREGHKLWVRDAEGEKEVQWGLPSPGYARAHPDNPNAKNARFRVEEVKLVKNLDIFLNNIKVFELRT